MLTQSLREAAFQLAPVRWITAIGLLLRGWLWLLIRNRYRAMQDFCWVVRVSSVAPAQRIARRLVVRMIDGMRRGVHTSLIESYLGDPSSATCAGLYSLSGRGRKNLLRDLIVLKRSTPGEKGVILIKYTPAFDAVVALFDVRRLMQHYVFVLEPSWAGYCDPSILMFISSGGPVIVQCFTDEDYEFIASIGSQLVPVRLGPADWVDVDVFSPQPVGAKEYDLVMVANWGGHKRHAQLFHALRDIVDREIRVLLVGFPWGRRTADDVRKDAVSINGAPHRIDILENVPHFALARYLSQCKVFVFLSRKEGDNKALVEAMFTNVPAIVYRDTIGGARGRVNPATGIFASDDELAEKVTYMLDHYLDFHPRSWALEHTGSTVATKLLNDVVRRAVIESGGTFLSNLVEKTNSPNLAYKDPRCRADFGRDYEFILSCRRG